MSDIDANKFTWVQTHKELAEYLKHKEDEQEILIEVLRDAGVTGLHDEEKKGNRIDLKSIDPFSFFCFIHKYGDKRRLKILQDIAEKLHITVPKDVAGIPSTNPMMVMMFFYARERNAEDISNLWKLFRQALDGSISDDLFKEVLAQDGVGPVKITETLFYVNPDKYFPINGPSKPYLKKSLGIDPSFKSYTEYQAVLNRVKKQTEEPFYKLSYEAWAWNEWQKKTSYWLFQGNPKKFDLEKSLRDKALSSWRVKAHKNKIKPGDKVILWSSGNNRGCYALCEVGSEVHEDISRESEIPYYKNGISKEKFDQVDLKITYNLVNNPVTYDQIKDISSLSDLKIGNQGTTFSATQEEYEALVKLAGNGSIDSKWRRLQATVRKIDNETAVRKFFSSVRYLVNKLEMDEDHPNLYAASVDYYLHLAIGGKYLTFVQFKNRKLELTYHVDRSLLGEFQSKYPNLEFSDGYKDDQSDTIFVRLNPNEVEIEDFLEASYLVGKGLENKYSKSSYRSIYPEVNNPWIIRVANNDDLLEKLLNGEGPGTMLKNIKKETISYPLNTIFYGPPGTGKTYTTIKRAAEIVEGRKITNYDDAKEIFHRHLHTEIEFITFHQNYSYEDFIQGLRPDTENDKELTFDRVDGVFKKMADKALKNYKASERPQTKKKSFEDVFNSYINPLVEGEVEEIEVKMKRVSYYITAVTNRSIEFRKASGGTAHTLSISTLRRMYEAESVMEIQGLSSYYSPLLDKLLGMGRSPGEVETVERKNYVMVIDEINRANISRVFGELITVIEPDKRYGRDMHIPAKLPSGETFSVPENLYIIGTMNTADKSIALLDIALRRRFEFEAMYPKYEINGAEIHEKDVLKKINERIIKLKGHDFQIGHSYFMKNHITLKQRMNRRVIPLLLEYFMNDEKEVKDILSHAGLKIKEGDNVWPLEITGRA